MLNRSTQKAGRNLDKIKVKQRQRRQNGNGRKGSGLWLCWARKCFFFFFRCDPSRAELSDTSSAALTLNWSGFVSSPLSHDPLLHGSAKGGGEPPWVHGIGWIAICLLPPLWKDVRLKLFYAWVTSFLHSSASRLLVSSLYLFFICSTTPWSHSS